MGLAQVGGQRARHAPGGGAHVLRGLHRLVQGRVQLLEVRGVQLDGVPVSPRCPQGGRGG